MNRETFYNLVPIAIFVCFIIVLFVYSEIDCNRKADIEYERMRSMECLKSVANGSYQGKCELSKEIEDHLYDVRSEYLIECRVKDI